MKRFWHIYFGALGALMLAAGLLTILTVLAGRHPVCGGWVRLPAGGFHGVWGSLVMVFGGVFMLAGTRDLGEVHHRAKLVIGCILLWIVGGTDAFALLAAAIPTVAPEAWLNTWPGFLKALAPPYTPALILLPFSLAVLFCLPRADTPE